MSVMTLMVMNNRRSRSLRVAGVVVWWCGAYACVCVWGVVWRCGVCVCGGVAECWCGGVAVVW